MGPISRAEEEQCRDLTLILYVFKLINLLLYSECLSLFNEIFSIVFSNYFFTFKSLI